MSAPATVTVGPGIREIDTLLGGWREATAAYLVEGDDPALVDTGSQSSAPAMLDALAGLDVGPSDLASIVLTHIHLDHAGGVGDLARAFPRATVYVHELGARHLVDPTRLIESTARAYGDLLDSLYGRLDPTPAERIRVLGDGEEVRLGGGRHLRSIHSPGHARHHLSLLDSDSGMLFAGEALGIRLPEHVRLRAATPAPDFDLDVALGSVRRLAEHRPETIVLAHYGLMADAPALLEESAGALRAWTSAAEAAWRAGRDLVDALREAFPEDPVEDPVVERKLEVLRGWRTNAPGLQRWIEQRHRPG